MIKNLISLYLMSALVSSSFARAEEEKFQIACGPTIDTVNNRPIVRICNNVNDIICKDVKLSDRRSCNEADQSVFNRNTTKDEIFHFAQGCFQSGVQSFTQFFVDFIPELLKGIWEATKMVSGRDSGLWSKLQGVHESSASVSSDIYEAAKENPGSYFDKIWTKIVDEVGPLVANYDCLNAQKKVESICGFVAGWIVPPAMLAKILVRGMKEVKFFKEFESLSAGEKDKLIKALEYSEKRSKLTLKQVLELQNHYKSLGYTADEFELIYKAGGLEKIKLGDMKPVNTPLGKQQRLVLLNKNNPSAASEKTLSIELKESNMDEFEAAKVHLANKEKEAAAAMAERQARLEEISAKTNAQQKKAQDEKMKADGIHVSESTMDDFKRAEAHQAAQASRPKDMTEPTNIISESADRPQKVSLSASSSATEVKLKGMEVGSATMTDFDKARAMQNVKAKKLAEEELARQQAINAKKINEEKAKIHDGMQVEEISSDDPRYIEFMKQRSLQESNPK